MAATRHGTSTKSTASGLLIVGAQGAELTAASSITITDSIHAISGSTNIATINGGNAGQVLWVIKDDAATWGFTTGGNLNITSTFTPVAGRAIQLFTANGTTWQIAALGDDKVDVSGDTMTGNLSFTGSAVGVYLDSLTAAVWGGGSATGVIQLSGVVSIAEGHNGSLEVNAISTNDSGHDVTFGIGTSSPSTVLDIEKDSTAALVDINNLTAGKAGLNLQSAGTTKAVIGLTGLIEGDSTTDLGFLAQASGGIRWYVNGSATEAAVLTSGGKLGVAAAAPTARLEAVDAGISLIVGNAPAGASGNIYAADGNINAYYGANADNSVLGLNYHGYQNGTTVFRDFVVYDGKETAVLTIDGSAQTALFAGAITEYGRAFTQGEWTTVAHNAAHFSAVGGGSWTVAAGDLTHFNYTIIGKTMTVSFAVKTSTVAIVATYLTIAIPASQTVSKPAASGIWTSNNGTTGAGRAVVAAGETVIRLYNETEATGWSNATDTTWVSGQISFEIV